MTSAILSQGQSQLTLSRAPSHTPSLTLSWLLLQAQAAGSTQPDHSPAAGAATWQTEPASAGETEPV